MHRLYKKADELSREVIGAAIEVHQVLGPGLLEKVYEKCLMRELELRGISHLSQREVDIVYKSMVFSEPMRFDILVENCLLVELKAVTAVLPIDKAKLLSYMKLLDIPIGLLMNFHDMRLVDGMSRLQLACASIPERPADILGPNG
ncbi:MAG: GxxExxY protein [Pirellulaceae bacterium]|nr:GxxExxY protein [Pirellulaceae bacterium]